MSDFKEMFGNYLNAYKSTSKYKDEKNVRYCTSEIKV